MEVSDQKPYYEDDFMTCLVIGGAGMLGFAIAEQLHADGKTVRILDLFSVQDDRFESIVGDIRDISDLHKALKGMDIVFQCAAAIWDPKLPDKIYTEVNVQGNENIIKACKDAGIHKLIYSSTIDVVVDGSKPIINGTEALPYPNPLPEEPYCRTKIIAEKLMCAANSINMKITCLRPACIYGPQDRYNLPNIINAVKGPLKFKLGDGSACFSQIYSENAAHAHILAAKHLGKGSPLPGNIYFVTDPGTNGNFFDFMEPFLVALGHKPPKLQIPYTLAYALSWIIGKINPHTTFTPFTIIQTCLDHTYSSAKAENDFGYKPIVGVEEAFQKTVEWFKGR